MGFVYPDGKGFWMVGISLNGAAFWGTKWKLHGALGAKSAPQDDKEE